MMEYLRWILLGIGVILVAAVYLWGRSRKNSTTYSPLDAANDMPSFPARDASDDTWRDGVGPVRVVHRERVEEVIQQLDEDDLPATRITDSRPASNIVVEPETAAAEVDRQAVETKQAETEQAEKEQAETDTEHPPVPAKPVPQQPAVSETRPADNPTEVEPQESPQDIPVDDVVALYIVADRGEELRGEQILSACYAGQLEYGDMKIFHRLDDNEKIVFSMASMMEPGWFDYEHMHEMKTRGITLFAQLRLCDDPVQALDDMLVCAHNMATLLNAQLCGPDRQLLNEVTAKSLREKARHFLQQKQGQ